MTKKKKKEIKNLLYSVIVLALLIGSYFTGNWNKSNSNGDTLGTADGELVVYFIDVGQADSIYIKDGNSNMLIDAGNNADGPLLVKYLRSLGIKEFKYAVGTHAHEDHIGGMDDIIKNFTIDKYYMPNVISTSKTFEDVLDSLNDKKISPTIPSIGDKFSLNQAQFEVLSVGKDAEDLNDTSVVLKMTYNSTCTLFMGDASSNIEKNLLDKDINCQVLKIGHHGSKYSSSDEFIKKVKPTYGIIMVGKDNKYGHPTKKVLDVLNKYNVTIHRTDEEGTIIMKIKGDSISFENIKTNTNG
mgnify:FL=1